MPGAVWGPPASPFRGADSAVGGGTASRPRPPGVTPRRPDPDGPLGAPSVLRSPVADRSATSARGCRRKRPAAPPLISLPPTVTDGHRRSDSHRLRVEHADRWMKGTCPAGTTGHG